MLILTLRVVVRKRKKIRKMMRTKIMIQLGARMMILIIIIQD